MKLPLQYHMFNWHRMTKYLTLFFVVGLVLMAVGYTHQKESNASADVGGLEVAAANVVHQDSRAIAPSGAVVNASSAISVEFTLDSKKILFEDHANKKLPIASLTKLITALIVLERYNLDENIVIDSAAMAQVGDQGELVLGQNLSVKNLLYISLMESSNKSAYALAEVMGVNTFVEAMNQRAAELGLHNTHFTDATGLNPNSYSTAEDVAALSQYLYVHYPLFREIVGLQMYRLYTPDGLFHHTVINTNELLGQDNVVGGKTGFTREAQGCVMILQYNPENNNYKVYVILGAENRFLEVKKIMQ